MFSQQIDAELSIELAFPRLADELYALVDLNRAHLRPWFPWVDATTSSDDTRTFLVDQMQAFARGEACPVAVRYQDRIVGMTGVHSICSDHQSGRLGYWIGHDHAGRGIMTRAVSAVIEFAKEMYPLRRIEIHCVTENERSRAMAERLGFAHEATLRGAHRINGRWHDLEIYGWVSDVDV